MAHVLEERILLSTITVTSLADNVTADGQITLREALAAANTNASVDGSTAGQSGAGAGGVQDTIVFQAGLTGTIALNGALPALQISDSVQIVGWGASDTVIDAQQNYRVFDVTTTAGNVTFEGVTVVGGRTTAASQTGAGIRFLSPGTLTLSQTQISSNSTTGLAARGAGIFNNIGTVVVRESLISGNSTSGQGGDGAGIFSENGPVVLINSTISGNSTTGYHADGLAIYTNGTSGDITLINSTVTANNNQGPGATGGAVSAVRGDIAIHNSIVSGNATSAGSTPDISFINYSHSGTFTALGSLIGAVNGTPLSVAPIGSPDANGNLAGAFGAPLDARLAALADNGGPTFTHALLPDSPAINAGNNSLALDPVTLAVLTTDQRGTIFARIDDGVVDMGSFEFANVNFPLVVTTAVDELDADVTNPADLSLREAIAIANALNGVQTISFDPGLSGDPIDLSLGQLQITESVTITGLGARKTVIDAHQLSRVLDVLPTAGSVTLQGMTITGGRTTASGDTGGAIRFRSSGTLTIVDSAVSGNTTAGNSAFGGAIYTNVGPVILQRSLLSGNSTTGRSSDGAAFFSRNAPLTLVNSTASGNFTAGYHADAAIYTIGGLASISLVNSTVTNNFGVGTEADGGGGIVIIRAAVSIVNSIVSGNHLRNGSDFDIGISGYANPATFTASYSLIGANTNNPLQGAPVGSPDVHGNLVGTVDHPIDALLAPLADNGGLTETHALFAGSPAIDAGSNSLAVDPITIAALMTDQRSSGFPRIDHGTVDMGSFEGSFPDYPTLVPNAPLVVTTASDELDADLSDLGDLSLREAIAIANAQFGPNVITFAPGLSDFPIQLTLGQLTVTDDLQVIGLGAQHTVIDALETSRVIDVPFSGVDLALQGVTITGGLTTANFESGGGIRMRWAGSLTLTNSAVRGNATTGRESFGGAIYSKSAAVTLHGSLLSGNATWGRSSDGAGIFSRNAPLTFINSTVSGNFTAGYHADAAIYTIGGLASVHLVNSTITNNYGVGTEDQGGGGVVVIRAPVTIVNSIVSGNYLRNGDEYDVGISGYANPATFTATHSLIGVNTETPLSEAPLGSPDVNGNLIGTPANPIDARLAPLADNGGPTNSHAPLNDSPAIDGGDNTLAADPFTSVPLTTDQRGVGFPRIDNGMVDMGAIEISRLIVTTADDELDPTYDADDLSLREALAIANAQPGLVSITFAPDLTGQIIGLSLGALTISDPLTITGLGPAGTIIDAEFASRVFDITSSAGYVTLDGMTIADGKTTADFDAGGGIRSLSTGTLTLLNTVVTGNSTHGSNSAGGGIYAYGGNLTLVNSAVTGNATFGDQSSGGGILVKGVELETAVSVDVRDSTISGNITTGDYSFGGGLAARFAYVALTTTTLTENSTTGYYAVGGAVYSAFGSVTMDGSELAGNRTLGERASGGAVWVGGDLTVTDSVISGNATFGGYAKGGGLFTTDGNLSVEYSTLSDNKTYGDNAAGGATYSGTRQAEAVANGSISANVAITPNVSISASTITGNATFGNYSSGGGLAAKNAYVTINYSSVTYNSTQGSFSRGGGVSAQDGDVVLTYSTVSGNSTAGDNGAGGGIYANYGTVTLNGSVLSDNSTEGYLAAGGAVATLGGDVTANYSTFSGNSTFGTYGTGGAIATNDGTISLYASMVSNNTTYGYRGHGAGVFDNYGNITITSSTVANNATLGFNADGAGVYSFAGDIEVTNSTISGNWTSGEFADGAGITNIFGDVTLTSATVAANSVYDSGATGGGIYSYDGSATVVNSIVAGNWSSSGIAPDFNFLNASSAATFLAQFSLLGNNDGIPLAQAPVGAPDVNGNLVGVPLEPIDPLLDSLANNGGPTETMALLPGSPAINAGGTTALIYDQRGEPRVVGITTDMGAFERLQTVLFTSPTNPTVFENTTAVLTVSASDPTLPGQTITYSLTGGADQDKFSISPSGELSFVTAPDYENPIDADANNVYLVQVTAVGTSGELATQELFVTVLDGLTFFYTDFETGLPAQITGGGSVTSSEGYGTGQFFQNDTVNPIQTTTLTLTNLPAHTSIDLNFLLSIINSWDGLDRSPTVSPDFFNVTIDGVSLFHETFSNFDTESQTYVAPDGVLLTPRIGSIGGTFTDVFADLGFSGESFWGDALYAMGKDPQFDNIPHTASTLTITWFASGAGYQGGVNESWALDNIEVILNNDPIFTSTAAPAVPENTTAVLTVTATNAGLPPQPVTYSITGGADQGKFSITPAGVLSFVNAPDYEHPTDTDADNVYLVQVTASDGAEASAVQYLSVTVSPVNDNTPVFTSTANFSVPENSTVVSTVTATDADLPAQSISYSITGGADQGKFSITPSGVLSFVTPPIHANPTDANADNAYLVQVTASDGAGGTTIQNLAVTVTDSTLAFHTDFESGLPAQITGGGSVVSSQGYGTGDFLQNTTVNPVVPTTLTLTNLPAHISIDLNFLLAIINTWDGLDRSPTASPDYFSVTIDGVSLFHETFSNFDTQSQTYIPPDGVLLTPRIGPIPGDRFFDVFPNLGFGGLPSSGEALYAMGEDPRFDNIPHTASTLTISWFASGAGYQGGENESWALDNVEVILHKNHDPVLISTATPTVPENTTTVLTVTATDSDLPAQSIIYAITGGADQSRFSITPAGVLSFVFAPDYENPADANADNVYLVQVTASDGAGGTGVQNLSVTIGNVVETTFATFTRPRYVPTPLTFAELKAETTVNIPSGHTLGFRVDAITTGSLQITHLGATTTASPGTIVVDGDTLTWTSAQGATGLTEAVRLSGVDLSDNQRVLADVKVRINLVNVAPFLSTVSTFDGGLQQTPYIITYEMLQSAANESDANSDVLGFRIRSIQNGSLTITKSGTSTAFPIVIAQTLVLPGDILTWTGGVTHTGNALPIFAIRAWDGLAGSGVDIQVSLNVTPFGTQFDLSGPWSVGGKLANINQSGSSLVLTDQNGQATAGAYTGLTTITGRFGLTGIVDTSTPDKGRIVWSDGAVWLKLSVGGQYYVSNPNLPNTPPALVKVVQSRGALTFFNRVGDSADATFVSPSIISIPRWKLTAIYADGALKISNGLTWFKLDLSPSYTESVSGLATSVIQRTNSVELTFVDTAGGTSSGFWQNPTQVKAADWNSIGTVINGQILWSGGTVDGQIWNKHLVLFGSGSGAGPGFVKIEATNNQILLTNKLGTVMHARLIDAYTLYNVDTGKYITRKNGKLDLGAGLIWSDFDFNALDAVFSDIKTFPFGI